MTKIVYNACYGGFGMSDAAIRRYLEIKGVPFTEEESEVSFRNARFRIGTSVTGDSEYFWDHDIERTDSVLAQVVEELGKAASGYCADLRIRELAPGTRYLLHEYDGSEWVETEAEMIWSVA